MLCSARSFISDHIIVHNCYYLLSLYKNYFDDIVKPENFDFDNILIDKKSHQNILIYDISYKFFFGATPLRVRFNKIDVFIRVYEGTRYVVLFGP